MPTAFQPAPGVASFQMIYGLMNQNVENVYHISKASAWTATQLGTMAAALQAWESGSASNSRTNSCALFKILARDLSVQAGAVFTQTPAAPIPGVDASGAMPGGVTIAIKWSTGLAGRSHRGRTFHIGLSRDQVSGNEINGGTATGLLVAYNALITSVAAALAGASLCVLSRTQNGVVLASAVPFQIQQAVLTDLATDSQRRRLENHNRHH